MQHIQGISCHQLQLGSLEDSISQDNPAPFIDAFVHSINLEKTEFTTRVLKTEAFLSFDVKVLLFEKKGNVTQFRIAQIQ